MSRTAFPLHRGWGYSIWAMGIYASRAPIIADAVGAKIIIPAVPPQRKPTAVYLSKSGVEAAGNAARGIPRAFYFSGRW